MESAFLNMKQCLESGNEPTSNNAKIKFRVFMLFYRKVLVDTKRATWKDFGGASKFMSATTDELLNHARSVYLDLSKEKTA
jgi:hypothetical protein